MKKREIKEKKVVFDHPYEPDFEVSPDKIVYVRSIQTYTPSNDELMISQIIYFINWVGNLEIKRINFWGKWEDEKSYSDNNYWDSFIQEWEKYHNLKILNLKPRRDYYPTNAERYIFNNWYIEKYENINDLNKKNLLIYLKIPYEKVILSFNNDVDRYNMYKILDTIEDHEPR